MFIYFWPIPLSYINTLRHPKKPFENTRNSSKTLENTRHCVCSFYKWLGNCFSLITASGHARGSYNQPIYSLYPPSITTQFSNHKFFFFEYKNNPIPPQIFPFSFLYSLLLISLFHTHLKPPNALVTNHLRTGPHSRRQRLGALSFEQSFYAHFSSFY